MTKQELIDIIGDAMWPTDLWKEFNGNVKRATRVAETLIEKLKLNVID